MNMSKEKIPEPSGLKVEIKRYRAVAYWKWDFKDVKSKRKLNSDRADAKDTASDDDEEEEGVCGICRQPFEATCPDCSIPGDDCPPVLGACSHAFHVHCIMKWLEPPTQTQEERRQTCPMCRAEWQIEAD